MHKDCILAHTRKMDLTGKHKYLRRLSKSILEERVKVEIMAFRAYYQDKIRD